MKVIFFGTPQFAVPTLERLLSHPDFEVLGVVTQPDKRRGRGAQLTPSPVKSVALTHSLPVWQPERIKKDALILTALEEAHADGFVVVAYGQILSARILAMPKLGCVNVHGSILPYYRGAAPIQWCLYHGERETGITTMLMDKGMDTGDMLLKSITEISLWDNAETLGNRLALMGADLLMETLWQLEKGVISPCPQENGLATYAPLIQKSDYILNWSRTALELHNQIRGFFPDCFTWFRGQVLKVRQTVPLGSSRMLELPEPWSDWEQKMEDLLLEDRQVGEVVFVAKGLGPVVQTGEGFLVLCQVQLGGKREQSGVDFVNGCRLKLGEIFGGEMG